MSNVESLVTEHIDIWSSAVKTKSSAGRGSSNKRELYGIKKLRELILELAVRGLLVAQDKRDEPASIILDKIAAEKEELIKEKAIKRQKKLPQISKSEIPFNLPNNWVWTRLGNAGIGSTGKTPSTKEPSNFDGEIPFIGPGQITLSGDLVEPDKHLSEKGLENSTEALPGDILMVCIGGSIGKSTISNTRIAFNQQINAIRPLIITSKYLNICVSAKYFYNSVLDKATGSATPIINRGKWEELLVPICSISQQKKIADKVDELMDLCDKLEQHTDASIDAHKLLVSTLLKALTVAAASSENGAIQFQQAWERIAENFDELFTTESSIDQLKQTILQLAVMGKLVPQDPSDEPASVLLEKIAAEKEQLLIEKKIKKQKSLASISSEEIQFKLPQGWQLCRLQDVTKLITDGKHGDCNNLSNSGYYFLSAKDIQNGQLCYENARQIVPSEFAEVHKRTNLEAGDICVVNTGATVGKMAVVTSSPLTNHTTFQKSVAVIKAVRPFCNEIYLSVFLRAEAKNLLKKSGGSAINNLLLGDLKKKVFMLPPLNEQKAIVHKVNELIKFCDLLKDNLTLSQNIKLKLTEAINKKVISSRN